MFRYSKICKRRHNAFIHEPFQIEVLKVWGKSSYTVFNSFTRTNKNLGLFFCFIEDMRGGLDFHGNLDKINI